MASPVNPRTLAVRTDQRSNDTAETTRDQEKDSMDLMLTVMSDTEDSTDLMVTVRSDAEEDWVSPLSRSRVSGASDYSAKKLELSTQTILESSLLRTPTKKITPTAQLPSESLLSVQSPLVPCLTRHYGNNERTNNEEVKDQCVSIFNKRTSRQTTSTARKQAPVAAVVLKKQEKSPSYQPQGDRIVILAPEVRCILASYYT